MVKYMMPDVGQRAPQKSGRTRILQKSPMTIIGKYLYHCWWGMNFLFIIIDFSVINFRGYEMCVPPLNHRRSWHGLTTPLFSNFLFTNLFSKKLFKESCKLTGAKYMHLYKCTCILNQSKSFIWIRYKMSFLDKS
jgi:hypothetical protein